MESNAIQKATTYSCFQYDVDLGEKPQDTIYLLSQAMKVVYVGQSQVNFFNRLNSHIKENKKKFNHVFAFNINEYPYTLDEFEHALISFFQPIYNVSLKGNTNRKDFIIMGTLMSDYNEYFEHEKEIEEYMRDKSSD